MRHTSSNKPIKTCADMKGLKIRVPDVPAYLAMPRACGANTAPIAFAEVYLALQNGTVEAHHRALHPRTPAGEPVPLASMPLMRALHGERIVGEKLLVRRPVPRPSDKGVDPKARAGGDLSWLVDATPVLGPHGTVIGAVCTYRDVTDRVLDEEMGDELLGTAAHDLRTPLTALKACVQLIERGLERLDGNARARTLALLVGQVDKLSAKIDDVLDASRIRRGRLDLAPVALDVGLELQKILDQLSRLPGAPACELRAPTGGLRAHCDPERLRQAVRGILFDAAARQDTPVIVEARRRDEGGAEILFHVRPAADSVRTRAVGRLVRMVLEKLGGSASDADGGAIILTLPPPRGSE
ncbi:MAG: hypothetical protein NVS3B10_28810 [Polyangiales bacterium]